MIVKTCLIQDSPVFFNKEETLRKLEELTRKYSGEGAELIVFPESYIPGYPRGFTFGTRIGSRSDEGRRLYAEYHRNSVDLAGPDRKRLEHLSRKYHVYLVIGLTEKVSSNGSLYCSVAFFSPESGLLGVHRKIKPTGSERIVWGEAGGESLQTFQTRIGRLGGLICWENYMPLARMSMYRQGIEIYIAPTADARESWTATMRHISLEGRCFVLGCNQYYEKSMYPSTYMSMLQDEPEVICQGGSVIVSPMGKILAGPLFDRAGAVVADLDLDLVIQSRMDFDVNGHYSRNDIFEFQVRNQPDIKVE
jgi:nitrilase